MRFLVSFILLAIYFYDHKLIPSHESYQIHKELRLLSFIPSLELYSKSQTMEVVDLSKIDFFKSKDSQEELKPVIDSLVYIPTGFHAASLSS